MEQPKKMSLAEFMEQHKPNKTGELFQFREDLITLHFSGYSLKSMFEFVQSNGYTGSQPTFYRWVKKNIDFDQVRPATTEVKPTPQSSEPKNEEKKEAIAAPEKRDPKAIMEGILGTSIEDQMREFTSK